MYHITHSEVSYSPSQGKKICQCDSTWSLSLPLGLLRSLLIGHMAASWAVATPWAAPYSSKICSQHIQQIRKRIGAAQANTIFASLYVLFSVECTTTLYSINFLFVIVHSLESRSRHTGAFPFPKYYMPCMKVETYQGWSTGKGGGVKQGEDKKKCNIFPSKPLHKSSSSFQQALGKSQFHSRTGMLITQVQNLWKITVEKSFTIDLWLNWKKWKCWTNHLLFKYLSISTPL